MTTTIKILSNGKALEAVGNELRLDGRKVNGLVARPLTPAKGEHTHYVPVGDGGIALTATEERTLRRHREAYQAETRKAREAAKAARHEARRAERAHDALYNEGADGYNPHRI